MSSGTTCPDACPQPTEKNRDGSLKQPAARNSVDGFNGFRHIFRWSYVLGVCTVCGGTRPCLCCNQTDKNWPCSCSANLNTLSAGGDVILLGSELHQDIHDICFLLQRLRLTHSTLHRHVPLRLNLFSNIL